MYFRQPIRDNDVCGSISSLHVLDEDTNDSDCIEKCRNEVKTFLSPLMATSMQDLQPIKSTDPKLAHEIKILDPEKGASR